MPAASYPISPRRGVRALTGYFGRAVGALRRSADHVEATAFVWRELVRLLQDEGISTWSALQEWLAATRDTRKRGRRVWPMPRDVRLSLPDAPGIYRMLRTSGDVLYVGKAASLRHRVNSYFRKQHGMPERTLEMLSQARGISFDVTPSALEAALFEPDEIKRHRPPYNVALTSRGPRVVVRATGSQQRAARTRRRSVHSDRFLRPGYSMNSLRSPGLTAARSAPVAGVPTRATFDAGYARLCAAHPELSRQDLGAHERLLRLGTRLWRGSTRPRRRCGSTMTTKPGVDRRYGHRSSCKCSLEWLALRAALARRRAIWLTRLVESSVGVERAR